MAWGWSKLCSHCSGHVRPRQGTEICNFGAPSPLEALHWIFCFFSSVYVQFSKTSPLKSGERSEKSSGENRVKSCHVCGCHGFFGLSCLSPRSLSPQSAWPHDSSSLLVTSSTRQASGCYAFKETVHGPHAHAGGRECNKAPT